MSIASMGILRASAKHICISGKSRDPYWSSVHSTHPYSVSSGCIIDKGRERDWKRK